jgi:hypothetical protein
MCSWGKGTAEGKFYKGVKNDSPWNKDLLWRNYVGKEELQLKQHQNNELAVIDIAAGASSKHPPRMRMGVTGTFIPDDVPPVMKSCASVASSRRSSARSARSGGGRSVRSARSGSSNGSAMSSRYSDYSISSSLSSRQMEELRETIQNETKQMQQIASREIESLKEAMKAEAGRREAAERKIELLTRDLQARNAGTD